MRKLAYFEQVDDKKNLEAVMMLAQLVDGPLEVVAPQFKSSDLVAFDDMASLVAVLEPGLQDSTLRAHLEAGLGWSLSPMINLERKATELLRDQEAKRIGPKVQDIKPVLAKDKEYWD